VITVNFVKLGSLYVMDQVCPMERLYNYGSISLGDTVPDQEITWVETEQGLMVSTQIILLNVSWKLLAKEGLILGKLVTIDGTKYLCRSLKTGSFNGAKNEWDDVLDEVDSDEVWNWKRISFWGQETPYQVQTHRVTRGCGGLRDWSFNNLNSHDHTLGFRPALERQAEDLSKLPPNTKIQIFAPQAKTIIGRFLDCTEYDLLIGEPIGVTSQNPEWYRQLTDGNVVVDRNQVFWKKYDGPSNKGAPS